VIVIVPGAPLFAQAVSTPVVPMLVVMLVQLAPDGHAA
jgi:hypothetical protein